MYHIESKKGFTLMEVMIVAGIGSIIAMAITSLIVTSVRASRSARAALEYANLISITKKTLDARTDCGTILGDILYEGEVTAVPQLSVYNQVLTVGDQIPSAGIELDLLQFEVPQAAPFNVDLTIGGVVQTYVKYDTQLVVSARRTEKFALGGSQMRPIPIPVTLYVEQATSAVRYCAGNDETQACSQVGGNYIPAQGGNPPSCDIRPAVGGCLIGGTFSYVNGACATANPYTGSCGCQQGYGAYTMVDYKPYKNATLTQKQCMSCAQGFTPNLNIDPLYDDTQLQDDLLCIQDPQENCPCQVDPNSPQCICFTNPNAPNCGDPCYTEPNGCSCLIATNGFQAALADPICQGYFGGGFGGLGGFGGFIGGGFKGGFNP